jgi:hypothetical protein
LGETSQRWDKATQSRDYRFDLGDDEIIAKNKPAITKPAMRPEIIISPNCLP